MSAPLDKIGRVLQAALAAADPELAVRGALRREGEMLYVGGETFDLSGIERIVAVGGGKGCAPMALALEEVLGDHLSAGLVNVKRGHVGRGNFAVRFGARGGAELGKVYLDRIELVEASHPLPDEAGRQGAARMVELLDGLGERDLAVVLLSGGGSALLTLPPPDITLGELRELNRLLLASGADIREVNAVRKHCSLLSGGQLAGRAFPARILTLILSDVVGSPLDAIASGPTTPDTTTFMDALEVVERRGLAARTPPSILTRLRLGASGGLPETLKAGDSAFKRVTNVIVGENRLSVEAALAAARREGFSALGLGSGIECEARELGRMAAGMALSLNNGELGLPLPACVVFGGETTVTLKGSGKGGRNLEAALAAAIALDRRSKVGSGVGVFCLATDGNDGPTDAAGAFALPDTVVRGRALGLDAAQMLEVNDSYAFFEAVGSLIKTGPTNTNVNDLTFLFAW